jgi:nitrate reductase NapAB chaperone NapD
MPVCSYVVLPRPGGQDDLAKELAKIEGCEVVRAQNARVLLLVTTTDSFDADVELRHEVEALPGIEALLMTFGEIDPETTVGDPLSRGAGRRRPAVGGKHRSGSTLPLADTGQARRPR